jgi:4-hydroxy-L-threonine phosphate dehydrogenase PdxA
LIDYTHLTKELKTVKIAVVDGQGGGIGSAVIKRLREEFGESVQIIALGTNSIATAQMIKARANKGATGENAIIQTASKMDVIVGPIGIVLAQAMMGEVSPAIAQAVAECPALKLLIPLSQEDVEIMGFVSEPLPHLVDKVIQRLKEVQQNV